MFQKKGDLTLFSFDSLSHYGCLIQAVSTRVGGVSEGIFHSLNLGFHVDDRYDAVLTNRQRFCRSLSLPIESIVAGQQVHGTEVVVVDGSHRGKGAQSWADTIPKTDAMVTNSPDIALMVLVADCAAILLYDPEKEAIGIAHGSWRGAIGGIVSHTVQKMIDSFGCQPEDIQVGISPSIGPCCYKVGEDVLSALRTSFPDQWGQFIVHQTDGSVHLNLWELLRQQLVESSIPKKKVETTGICTACNMNLFYSHRGEMGKTGRNGALISLHTSD